jgi:hypothetical protein
MLNPDGVDAGNSRCTVAAPGLGASDMNRQWSDPTADSEPVAFRCKELISTLAASRGIVLALDFHTHPYKWNFFCCGSFEPDNPSGCPQRQLPFLLEQWSAEGGEEEEEEEEEQQQEVEEAGEAGEAEQQKQQQEEGVKGMVGAKKEKDTAAAVAQLAEVAEVAEVTAEKQLGNLEGMETIEQGWQGTARGRANSDVGAQQTGRRRRRGSTKLRGVQSNKTGARRTGVESNRTASVTRPQQRGAVEGSKRGKAKQAEGSKRGKAKQARTTPVPAEGSEFSGCDGFNFADCCFHRKHELKSTLQRTLHREVWQPRCMAASLYGSLVVWQPRCMAASLYGSLVWQPRCIPSRFFTCRSNL